MPDMLEDHDGYGDTNPGSEYVCLSASPSFQLNTLPHLGASTC